MKDEKIEREKYGDSLKGGRRGKRRVVKREKESKG